MEVIQILSRSRSDAVAGPRLLRLVREVCRGERQSSNLARES